jgi:ornithine decarboxylase
MNAVLKLVDVDFGARELSRPLNLIDAIKDYSDEMPLYCFAPSELQATYRRFAEFFPGQVTYAVKANPEPQIIETLLNEGMAAFDVASLNEIALVRGFSKTAELHYNNPIRSRRENDAAFHQHEVRSFSVDCIGELRKLKEAVADQADLVEASIRFHLDLGVAGYDFGTKFGATPEEAIALVAEAEALGFRVSLTFHPGSQCRQANAYRQYIEMASQISKAAGCELSTLNVGGGFPVQFPEDKVEDLKVYMDEIVSAVDDAFPEQRPDLVCEPGRAMVANSVALVTKVKAIKGDGRLYLNDGVYGGFQESHIIKMLPRYEVFSKSGERKAAEDLEFTVFGPTCDSLDQLPGKLSFPNDLQEEDIIVFYDMGAYGSSTTTNFNGYSSKKYIQVSNFC